MLDHEQRTDCRIGIHGILSSMKGHLPKGSCRRDRQWSLPNSRRLFAIFVLALILRLFFGEREFAITQEPQKSPYIRFVLFLGMEGTGHHFWQDLIKESRSLEELKEVGLHPEYTNRLTKSLYRHQKSRWKGLWSAPCKWDASDPTPNGTSIERDLVETLQEMEEHVHQWHQQKQGAPNGSFRDASSQETRPPILFPVNFLPVGNEFGVASYPTFLKPCRALQYPNIDLWYQACQRAGVLCEHVYIFRDPYSVIQSTTDNRSINKDKLQAIHLYTTQLQILHSQLLMHPDRLIGCWNYDEALSTQHCKEEIEPVMHFGSEQKCGAAIERVYRRRPKLTKEDKEQLIPRDFDLYMQSMVRIHDAVVQACETVKQPKT